MDAEGHEKDDAAGFYDYFETPEGEAAYAVRRLLVFYSCV